MTQHPSIVSLSQLRRGPLLTFGFFIIAAYAAYQTAGMIISGDFTSLAYVGLLCGGAAIALGILNNWRNGVYFFLAWLLFEDFARKFLGNNMVIYFAKDIFLLLIYLSFFAAYRRKDKRVQVFRPPFLTALLVFVWFGAIQIFNPGSTSVFYGLLGMKIYFYYMPLVFLGYALIDSEEELRRFFFINLGLVLIIVALGVAQSIIGPSFLNPGTAADDLRNVSQNYREAPISKVMVYRPTSVFVSTGRFSDMLILSWQMIFGFCAYLLLRSQRGRKFAFIALTLCAAGCFMCASRGVLMWSLGGAAVGSVAFLWGAPWKQGEAMKVIRSLQRAALGIAVAVGILLFTYPDALLNRLAVYSETLNPNSPSSELVFRARDYPLQNFMLAFTYDRWPYGYGIGTASLGGQYVSRILHAPSVGVGVESGFGNLVIEMGVGGLLLWLIMSFSVLTSAWKIVRKLKGSPLFPLAFMLFFYAFLLLLPLSFMGIQAYQDFILNAYLWLLLGVLFRLPTIVLAPLKAKTSTVMQPRLAWTP